MIFDYGVNQLCNQSLIFLKERPLHQWYLLNSVHYVCMDWQSPNPSWMTSLKNEFQRQGFAFLHNVLLDS